MIEQKLNKPYVTSCIPSECKVLDVDTTGRRVVGIANTMNYFDYDQDIIMPGAFQKSLKERGVNSQAVGKIKHAMFHDMTQLPFKPEVIDEREIDGKHVLYFESRAAKTQDGDDALEKYKEGIYDNHSIGFNYVSGKIKMIEKGSAEFTSLTSSVINGSEMAKSDYAFVITEVKLWEYSTVAFGANPLTAFLGVKHKSHTEVQTMYKQKIQQINKMLSHGSITDEGMKELEITVKQLEAILNEIAEMPERKADVIIPPEVPQIDAVQFRNQIIKNLKTKN